MARQHNRKAKASKNNFASLNLELKEIYPLTNSQEQTFTYFEEDNNLLLLGKAGTGKTFQAIYHALKDIQNNKRSKILIVRSPVATKDIGFLPGDLVEKGSAYNDPYVAIVNELFGRDDAYAILVKHNIIEFKLSSYIRGITIDNTCIIYDEIQNATLNEAISVVTRAGKNTKVHFCGDIAQCDLTKQSDRKINKFLSILKAMPEYREVYFTVHDIVRSGLVKSFLKTQHKLYGDEVLL